MANESILPAKQQKPEVNYRPAEQAMASCATCMNFVPDTECQVVEGDISPVDICDLHAPLETDTSGIEAMLFGGPNG